MDEEDFQVSGHEPSLGQDEHQSGSYPVHGAAQIDGASAGTWPGRGKQTGCSEESAALVGRMAKSVGPRVLQCGKDLRARNGAEHVDRMFHTFIDKHLPNACCVLGTTEGIGCTGK